MGWKSLAAAYRRTTHMVIMERVQAIARAELPKHDIKMNAMSDYEAYIYAIQEQISQHIAGLNELSKQLERRPLSFNERSATERNLQVLIEAAIGCSKHLLKKAGSPTPSEARASIERIYEAYAITSPDINEMRGAIGMRNAIIHDYLNLDWQKIEAVLQAQKYVCIEHYIKQVLDELRK